MSDWAPGRIASEEAFNAVLELACRVAPFHKHGHDVEKSLAAIIELARSTREGLASLGDG